ncbi:MAG: hypothetical protein HUJ22_12315 [Gracilimonas sp.]|uniref:hypothetical protein n=1 Tax=Gracilimonas sp. TaxID=1974203 RepID=UPI0019A5EC66|nr:hypothetical protein [Gracilimonas sp.]MBD3617343.1 hypothetical protein [Gracilimonas sp.]
MIDRELNKMLENLNIDSSFTDSTYLKIELLKSMKLIPIELLEICGLLNSIRNKFAHHLEADSFEKEPIKSHMNNLRKHYKCFYPNSKDTYGDYDYFRGITIATQTMIIEYNASIYLYGKKIREQSILDSLK